MEQVNKVKDVVVGKYVREGSKVKHAQGGCACMYIHTSVCRRDRPVSNLRIPYGTYIHTTYIHREVVASCLGCCGKIKGGSKRCLVSAVHMYCTYK